MKTVLRFFFECVDGIDCDVNIFVLVNNIEDETKCKIDDAIASYIDSVEDWQYEELVNDVLTSFNLDYEIISPITFCI